KLPASEPVVDDLQRGQRRVQVVEGGQERLVDVARGNPKIGERIEVEKARVRGRAAHAKDAARLQHAMDFANHLDRMAQVLDDVGRNDDVLGGVVESEVAGVGSNRGDAAINQLGVKPLGQLDSRQPGLGKVFRDSQ